MTIKLRDYDLAAGIHRLRLRIDRDRGVVRELDGTLDAGFTLFMRQLEKFGAASSAPATLSSSIIHDLAILPAEYGGTVVKVNGGYAASADHVTLAAPLVRALMILRGHPRHPGFRSTKLLRPEQPSDYPIVDVAPLLERLYSSAPATWSLEQFENVMFEGARTYGGDVDIEPRWTPDMIFPGSHIGRYMWPLASSTVYSAAGAFGTGFSRRDALVGEWWLLQPVSPRLNHHQLAQKFGLHYDGILPPSHVDAAGRVVLACFPSQEMSDAHRISLIEDSKFVAGYQKVMWSKTTPPLDDPSFDLAKLEGVTEDAYGPYRHSSELPPWPSSKPAMP